MGILSGQFRAKSQLFLSGILNYFGFYIILSSTESICQEFDKESMVTVLPMLATMTGITMIALNAAWI